MNFPLRTSDGRAVLILAFLVLATSLPFVNRAYFVDDYYFVTMAKGILQHPLRPYDFISDDAGIGKVGWERGQRPRMVNPPGFHYFLAAVIKVWGDEAWKLRTASLIFSLISVWCVYFLGKRFVGHPLAAASLMAITPAFWLTSYSLLIDAPLLACFLASLLCYVVAHERNKTNLFLLAGVLMAYTSWVKYTGVLIVPLVVAWHFWHGKESSWKGTALSLTIFTALFGLWGLWGILTYGQMHFLATLPRGFHAASPDGLVFLVMILAGTGARYSIRSSTPRLLACWFFWGMAISICAHHLFSTLSIPDWLSAFYFDKWIAVASFLGGCTVFLFISPFLILRRSRGAFFGVVLVMAMLFLVFHSRIGGYTAGQSATLVFFIGSTLSFIGMVTMGWVFRSDPPERFLLFWLGAGLLELILVMPWTAGRYLLIILPPVCWLFTRYCEDFGLNRSWRTAWCVTCVLGAALAYVDYAQAGVVTSLADVLTANRSHFEQLAPQPPAHWYYLADTFDGSQPYVLKLGWQNVFPYQTFQSGDLFLRSVYRKSSWWKVADPEEFHPVAAWEFKSWIPLRVMDVPASAGFYASCWGVLPYVVTRHPLERFELYRRK